MVVLAIGLAIGAAATGVVWASSGGSAEVRVMGRVLDDGRVEVVVQQRDVDAADLPADLDHLGWLESHFPESRFIPANAVPNRWYRSSSVEIVVEEPEPPVLGRIGPYEIAGSPTVDRPFDEHTLFCVITHGVQQDFFWFQVYSALLDSERWHDIDLRAEMYEDSSDQAAAIGRCVEDGAAAIATTPADPDTLQPALETAADAGVRVVTFNSGTAEATDAGSIAHVGLDDSAVGRMAAEAFVERDVSGDIICVIHEASNSGLEERCDSLEANYDGGSVVRVRTANAEDAAAVIATAATGDVGGAIALNAHSAYELAEALSASSPDIVLAAVTSEFAWPLAMLHSGRLSFVLWSHALEQGYLTTTALLYGHGTPLARDVGLFSQATQIRIEPSLISRDAIQSVVEADSKLRENLPAWLHDLDRAIQQETASEATSE